MDNAGSDSHDDQKNNKEDKEQNDEAQNENAVGNGNVLRCFTRKCLLQVFLILVVVARIPLVFVFILFDQKCVYNEKASILKCTQKVWFPHPECFIVAWFVISIVSSICFVFFVRWNREDIMQEHKSGLFELCCSRTLCGKGYFWSFNILCGVSIIIDIIRTCSHSLNDEGVAISISLLFWSPVTLAVVYLLNFLAPVKHSYKFLYWLSLCVYLLETGCMLLAVTVDAVLNIAPIIMGKDKGEAFHLNGLILIGLGVRALFQTRLFTFFWQKIFHGNKDLLSEPNVKLSELYKDHGVCRSAVAEELKSA